MGSVHRNVAHVFLLAKVLVSVSILWRYRASLVQKEISAPVSKIFDTVKIISVSIENI